MYTNSERRHLILFIRNIIKTRDNTIKTLLLENLLKYFSVKDWHFVYLLIKKWRNGLRIKT